MKAQKILYLILDNIRSLHNVGSMFRTADAFGVTKIYLCGYTGKPVDRLGKPVKEITKTALGAEHAVPWEYAKHTWRIVEALKDRGVHVVALENNVKGVVSLEKFRARFPLALIVGNEVYGISPAILKRADAIVSIPMHGTKESLNVSVACGIALWETFIRLTPNVLHAILKKLVVNLRETKKGEGLCKLIERGGM